MTVAAGDISSFTYLGVETETSITRASGQRRSIVAVCRGLCGGWGSPPPDSRDEGCPGSLQSGHQQKKFVSQASLFPVQPVANIIVTSRAAPHFHPRFLLT